MQQTSCIFSRAGSVAAVSVASAACGGSDTPTNGTIGAPVAVTPAVVASPAYVPLARGAHPFARPENDIGLLDPETRISNLSIVFKPTAAQSRDLETLRAAQLDPSSPSYRAWLTPEAYAARFGASADVLAKTNAWLAGQGLEVHAASRLGTRVTFSGKVADLQKAFHAEMHRYLVGGETHYAMSTAPAIPTDLADVVLAVHNTHDFHPRPMIHSAPVDPEYTGTHGDGLGPSDWATVYDVTPLYSTGVTGTPLDGTGITIAIVGVAEISQSDIAAFRTTFGLLAANVTGTTLVPNTGAAAAGTQGTGEEAFLDVEWAGGIAKGATINYVYVGGDDANVDDATYYAIEQNIAPILSESWGGCEAGLTPSDADVVAVYGSAANVLGITYLAAAGDSGAAGCIGAGPSGLYVSLPAAYPGVTSVGGTEFPNGSLTYDTADGNVTGYSALEEVWDEGNDPNSGVGAGGGGISIVFPRPSYQSALATCPIVGSLPTSVTPSAMRQVPDLSVSAASGNNAYFIECSVSQTTHDCAGVGGTPRVRAIGGTSASTPSFAGVVALIEQATGTRLGNINPMLYEIATTTPTAYHDITIGNNEVVCTPGTDPGCASSGLYGFAAGMGYDCATGIGSIDGVKLLEAWAALTPTSTTIAAMPTASSEGANVSLSATVTALSPSAALLDGTVTFAFESYLRQRRRTRSIVDARNRHPHRRGDDVRRRGDRVGADPAGAHQPGRTVRRRVRHVRRRRGAPRVHVTEGSHHVRCDRLCRLARDRDSRSWGDVAIHVHRRHRAGDVVRRLRHHLRSERQLLHARRDDGRVRRGADGWLRRRGGARQLRRRGAQPHCGAGSVDGWWNGHGRRRCRARERRGLGRGCGSRWRHHGDRGRRGGGSRRRPRGHARERRVRVRRSGAKVVTVRRPRRHRPWAGRRAQAPTRRFALPLTPKSATIRSMPKVTLKVRDLRSGESSTQELPDVDAAIVWLTARPPMIEVHGVVFEGLTREENDRMRAATRPLDEAERKSVATHDAAADAEREKRDAALHRQAEVEQHVARAAAKNADPNRPMSLRYRFARPELENTDAHDERKPTEEVKKAVHAWVDERIEWVKGRGQTVGEAKVTVYPGPVPANAERVVSGSFVPVSATPIGSA